MRRLPRSRRTWLLAAALATAFAAVSFAAFRSLVPESRTSVLPPRSSDEISLPPPGAVEPRQVEPRQTELQAASGRPALPPEQAAPKKAERDAAPRRGAPADAHLLELGVLQRARVAVANGQFATALEAIAEHQRRFPNGSLQEEREALRVKALAGLGKTDDASAAARRFREKFPNSVLSPRRENAPPKAP